MLCYSGDGAIPTYQTWLDWLMGSIWKKLHHILCRKDCRWASLPPCISCHLCIRLGGSVCDRLIHCLDRNDQTRFAQSITQTFQLYSPGHQLCEVTTLTQKVNLHPECQLTNLRFHILLSLNNCISLCFFFYFDYMGHVLRKSYCFSVVIFIVSLKFHHRFWPEVCYKRTSFSVCCVAAWIMHSASVM